MTERFEGRVVLVTGGASGIGRATVLRLAAEGAAVVIADVDADAGDKLRQEVTDDGHKCLFVRTDVTEAGDCERAVREAASGLGRLDVLATCAGIGGGGSVDELSEADWDRMLGVDLRGAFLASRFAVPAMREGGGGSIVHVSSIGGLRGNWGGAHFTAAKSGLIGLTLQMATAHAADRIRVNAIAPGVIETPLTGPWLADPAIREAVTARHPLGRLGAADEVAAAIAFLASDDASFVTGAVLPVDGGSLAMGL